ncbi:dephospho-CoA kinase [Asticcacaulis excentricus]|uniref:Dephospho-CoA kinase n=1 Tax=Asticcacaulis excentricus (strain ATCC 15261 / DSM 4724 / KCTC 12464 / NCIMB 9791 / VKM B-1370 / CB 48) TaxID=573065 RepID=E8RNT9_ASTEC|nr:dephospho-CoA kinase [Asticcacaulis excentricus]ADU11852.1 dephospho-CoA kinase [Asticcacaulis excentricus CB 48]
MIRLGLTGSIGMGKSTIARMFADEGLPVWDADETVHRLYATSEPLKAALVEAFGEVLTDGSVDRAKLSLNLKAKPDGFARLNALVHPATVADREAFLVHHAAAGTRLTLCDIPLLFETGAQTSFDKVVVVSAPPEVQAARVLARPGMTAEKFADILARQMPDAEKRRRADFVIDTSQTLQANRQQVREIIRDLHEA